MKQAYRKTNKYWAQFRDRLFSIHWLNIYIKKLRPCLFLHLIFSFFFFLFSTFQMRGSSRDHCLQTSKPKFQIWSSAPEVSIFYSLENMCRFCVSNLLLYNILYNICFVCWGEVLSMYIWLLPVACHSCSFHCALQMDIINITIISIISIRSVAELILDLTWFD